jgi:hypothetical protein
VGGVAGVKAYDLACVVDVVCNSTDGGQGIIDRGVGSRAVEKPMVATTVVILSDDLARIVDAVSLGHEIGLQRIIKRGVVVGGHDRGSFGEGTSRLYGHKMSL